MELALSLDALAKARAMTGDHADLDPLFQEAADLVADDPRLLARIQSSWAEYQVFRGLHEHVLRHLVVRTDEDLKRAARKAKVQPTQPWETAESR